MKLNQLLSLNQYFDLADTGADLQELIIDALILIIMSLALSWVYTHTAQTLSNRKRLAAIFPLLSLTTMMIIAIIKSSLALSLGLVGALSIVRFRSAIKEPEELSYIFLAMSLGLGMGASQRGITVAFFLLAVIFILIKTKLKDKVAFFSVKDDQSFYLDLTISQNSSIQTITDLLKKDCHFIELKRVEQHGENQRFLLVIKVKSATKLDQIKKNLLNLDPNSKLVLLNDERLFA